MGIKELQNIFHQGQDLNYKFFDKIKTKVYLHDWHQF